MSQIQSLFEKVNQDPALRDQIKSKDTLNEIVNTAREAGFDISVSDLVHNEYDRISKLSNAELESSIGSNAMTIRSFYKVTPLSLCKCS